MEKFTFTKSLEDLQKLDNDKQSLLTKYISDIVALLHAENLNGLHYSKVFNSLSEFIAPKTVCLLYKELVYPIYLYLDYRNNFLTVDSFLNYYEIDCNVKANEIINRGKWLLMDIAPPKLIFIKD